MVVLDVGSGALGGCLPDHGPVVVEVGGENLESVELWTKSSGWSADGELSAGRAYVSNVLDLAQRVLYDPPPAGGLDPEACETRECFLVEPVALLGERGIEIPLPDGTWFFEDITYARQAARRWLERMERSLASGARAHVRHGEVLVHPRTGCPTSQLAGPAPILDLMQTGCALEQPCGPW
jgi:hypothetical protein